MILDHFNEKWTFWDLWLGTSNSLLSKTTIYLPLSPTDPLRTCSKPCYFDLILHHLDLLRGPGRTAARSPDTSCLWAGGPAQTLQSHARNLKFWVILTTFPIEKVNFGHFAYQGSVKMPFWPLFWPHFEPSWAQTFGPWPKCVLLGPLPGWTLEGPSGTLNLTYFDHFGPLCPGVLEEAALG